MVQALKKKLKNEKGFTLIELLAVIVILGIIAAIAIPSINNIIQKSRLDAVKQDANAVYSAAKLYASEHPTDTSITGAELTGSVVDHTSLTNITVSVQNDGSLKLTADGTAGTLTIHFVNATYANINSDYSTYTVTSNAITIPAAS